MSGLQVSSLRVEAYVEAFEELRTVRESKSSVGLEDVIEDRLEGLWNELSVAEVEDVYRRYPELRIRRLA